MKAHRYTYADLQGADEIRLLQVSKCGARDFKYTIVHTSLEDALDFQTVSYVWGQPARTFDLLLSNESHLPITESINESILFSSRHCWTGYLWIDQLCINQSNITERIHQVKMMGDIYRRTSHVLVWIGEQDKLPRGLWELDRRVEARFGELQMTGATLKVSVYVPVIHDFIQKGDEQWTTFSRLLRRHWFSRAWVLQEVLLAKEVSAIFGSELFPFANLLRLLRIFLRAYQDFREDGLHFRAVEEMYEAWVVLRGGLKRMPFYQILRNFGGVLRATDGRDHVFAFLGLKAECHIDIEPNYSPDATAETVYISTASAIIKGSRSLNILHTCGQIQPSYRKRHGLPSWVPHWKHGIENAPIWMYQFLQTHKRAPQASTLREHAWKDVPSPKCLTTRGKIIGSVYRKLAPRFEGRTGDCRTEDLTSFFDLEGKLEAVNTLWPSTAGPAPTKERLLRAILADSARENDIPSEALEYPGFEICNYEMLLRTYEEFQEIRLLRYGFPKNLQEAYVRALQFLSDVAHSRSLLISSNGKLGLGFHAEEGDMIAILHGCDVPVVLRPKEDGSNEMVEVIYLEDTMYGETVDWTKDEADRIILV